MNKILWGLILIIIVFLAGGLWQPILYGGLFDLTKFLIGGLVTLIIMLAGGGLFYRWATKPHIGLNSHTSFKPVSKK